MRQCMHIAQNSNAAKWHKSGSLPSSSQPPGTPGATRVSRFLSALWRDPALTNLSRKCRKGETATKKRLEIIVPCGQRRLVTLRWAREGEPRGASRARPRAEGARPAANSVGRRALVGVLSGQSAGLLPGHGHCLGCRFTPAPGGNQSRLRSPFLCLSGPPFRALKSR